MTERPERAAEDWPRLAGFIEQRLGALRLQWKDIELRGGPSTAKVREIRNGTSQTLSRSKRRDLERALEWMESSVDEVLAGGVPKTAPGSPPAPSAHVSAAFSSAGSFSATTVDLRYVPAETLLEEIRRRLEEVHAEPTAPGRAALGTGDGASGPDDDFEFQEDAP